MTRARARGFPLAVLLTAALVASGCGAGTRTEGTTLTVLAAASLTESFREMGERFERAHPDVEVRFNFQGSALLAERIRQGAGGDVFASADRAMMNRVVRAGAVAERPRTFATNRLTVVVPPSNPAGVRALSDLAAEDVSVVVCAPRVPCGAATERVETVSGVRLNPVSEENDVKDVLHKVEVGEADAGLVYVTDAEAAGDKVRTVDFPASERVTNEYPLATLEAAEHPDTAEAFVEFVRGDRGRRILREYGFGTP
ncbi:molybdate ABC transporter substrate-binding protein [Actinopolyspora mortivallis]|uniref:molybdate ABC transporter substrate-binding protein n=1 Tax=Actinopolyspora mortivallis TaxID=33906 RepID=UPI00035D3670|nr:molybdate ABC transporter substrate-binding protein [Actinopolyspora mortivallis]